MTSEMTSSNSLPDQVSVVLGQTQITYFIEIDCLELRALKNNSTQSQTICHQSSMENRERVSLTVKCNEPDSHNWHPVVVITVVTPPSPPSNGVLHKWRRKRDMCQSFTGVSQSEMGIDMDRGLITFIPRLFLNYTDITMYLYRYTFCNRFSRKGIFKMLNLAASDITC